ncbi:MAG: NEW3 domain-containing protein [Dehalococcoidales bacterium]|nr:NEW3 domain-containing protein [Dehalococcoidales bacterium]
MRMLRLSLCLWMLLAMVLPFVSLPAVALAEETTSDNTTVNLTLTAEFPKLEAVATGSFEFYVKMVYEGKTDRLFDLSVVAPPKWDAYITPQYDTKRISSINMEKPTYGTTTTKTVKLNISPPTWPYAEPGEYQIKFQASSGELTRDIYLTAKVTAKYTMSASPTYQRYNMTARAGAENVYSITITNTGTEAITNITFTADKPSGWEVTFKPEKIERLEIYDPKVIDVVIKPPVKTVAGDYRINLRASGKEAYASSIDVRVTVETPSIWGWLGVAIIVIVVLGLIFIFMRFGRR